MLIIEGIIIALQLDRGRQVDIGVKVPTVGKD